MRWVRWARPTISLLNIHDRLSTVSDSVEHGPSVREFGFLGVWEFESLGVWEFGSLRVWEFGSLGVLVPGRVQTNALST